MNTTLDRFDVAVDHCKNPQAAALLVLAHAVTGLTEEDSMSHTLGMGIRKGLFGADAGDHESILSLRND